MIAEAPRYLIRCRWCHSGASPRHGARSPSWLSGSSIVKRGVVSALLLVASTALIQAADLVTSPARSPWEGFYAGAHVGDTFAGSTFSPNSLSGSGGATVVGEDGQYGPVLAGFQLGANHVTPTGLLIGVEGDFSFPDTLRSQRLLDLPDGGSIVDDNVEIFGSLRGRVGRVFGDWLVYGTGGVAYDHDRVTDSRGDNVYFTRPGWTAGAGVEAFLTSKLSAKFEYAFFDYARVGTYLPIVGAHYQSDLSFQTLRFGLNYHFDDRAFTEGASHGVLSETTLRNLSIHAQSTIIAQANAPFAAAYSGINSLSTGFQARETFSVTGFFGYRAFEGTEFYFNPEPFQGFGLSNTHGLAGFSNLEAQKAGSDFPHTNTSRLFLRQIIGLGGEREDLPDGPNQVEEAVDVSRVTFTFGKLSVPDIFDNNAYAHDGRVGFMNWSFNDASAFDFAADQRGYTYGTALELNQKDCAVRAGYFLLPDVPNGINFDTRVIERGQSLLEFQHGYTLLGSTGILRLTGWESQCYCGSFAATLSNPFLSDPLTDGGSPNVAATRKTRSEYGIVGNLEQTVSKDLGLFARISYRSGQTEITSWTDADEGVSVGGVLRGTSWGRPDDAVGFALGVNGLSGSYQRYLGAGGLGINIGDGRLDYRPEQIFETYYSVALSAQTALTFDYQFIANPADNYMRGPVSIGAVRLHFAL